MVGPALFSHDDGGGGGCKVPTSPIYDVALHLKSLSSVSLTPYSYLSIYHLSVS